ncbi:L-threonylcarbamoyladenylate synthase [Flavobacterium antarcticum]|uniref:L-threonylcarbamoyladenylate synthase n=1 Tax=Flavobacterium antarcticum TaxID=271155 RepID=UPI0003B55E38|nr:L-threonylcarbamoyladenylate synthase [Flavobacterium antarcticum]
MTEINTNIEQAILILKADDLVAIPTETVYGLAANAFSETAVEKIFKLKKRPSFNPLIVHIGSIVELDRIAKNIPPLAIELAKAFWPGPLTLLLEKTELIPNLVTAQNKTVAVRMPNHPATLQLLSELDFPLAAPSANPFMSVSPTKPEHVKKYFDGKLKMILDGGFCSEGIESTILGFENNNAVLYRQGSCSTAEIEKITGKLLLPKSDNSTPKVPGMLKRHYAPKTKFILTSNYKKELRNHANKKIGIMLFSAPSELLPNISFRILSEKESLKEAAQNLFATLIELDAMKLDLIIAVYVPNKGIGKSINDRLERAASL